MQIGAHTMKIRYFQTPLLRERKSVALLEKKIFLNTIALLTAVLFGIVYVVQINSLATKGHRMRTLEKSIIQQKDVNKKLETQLIEAQALGLLQERIGTLGLVRSDHFEFIQEKHPVAALR